MTLVETHPIPGVEAWVWAEVGGPGVKSFLVDRTSVGPGWVSAFLVQIDTRGSTREAAWTAAEANLRAVQAMAGTTYPDGVLGAVEHVSGPAWLPDGGQPRYVTRVRILAHP